MPELKKRRRSLRWRILVPTLVLVNLALLALYQVATTTSGAALHHEVLSNLEKTSSNLASRLAQAIDDTRADAVSTAALDMPAEAIESGDAKNIVFFADKLITNKSQYHTIFVVDDVGEVVATNSVDKAGTELPSVEGNMVGKVAWFSEVAKAEAGTPVWIPFSRPVFLGERLSASEQVGGYALPIIDIMGDTIGAVGILVPSSYLASVIDGFTSPSGELSTFATLFDGNGAVVAMPSALMSDKNWLGFSSGADLSSVSAPNGDTYVGKSAAVGGSVGVLGWTAVAYESSSTLEAPVAAMSRTLLIVALVAVLVTMLVLILLISRILAPIQGLTAATTGVDRPSDYKPVDIVVNDEVGVLTGSFNQVFAKLADFQEGLEEKVRKRTEALGARNRDMRRVFENVDQGFITLDKSGVMATERSAVVDMWFGSYEENVSFATHLANTAPDFAVHFEMAWESLEDGFMPLELCIEQLPQKLEVNGQFFSLRYTVLKAEGSSDSDDEEAWDGVLVIIADVGEKMALEKAQTAQRELGNAIKAVMKDKKSYKMFHHATGQIVERIVSGAQDSDLDLLKRSVHTVKGNVGLYGFDSIASLCHRIEDGMAESNGLPAPRDVAELKLQWDRLDESIQFILGAEDDDKIHISTSEYNELLEKLYRSGEKLFEDVFSWQLEPLDRAFERLAERTHLLAERIGMSEVEVTYQSNGLLLDPSRWAPLWEELIHVLRNSLDHGLKDMEGLAKLSFSGSATESEFVLQIQDNGAGIDWEKIAMKAKERGLPTGSHRELVDALFHDGLSTNDEVSTLSGRGVGMSAVRAHVLTMGGGVDVLSKLGNGTIVQLTFPLASMFGDLHRDTCQDFGSDENQITAKD